MAEGRTKLWYLKNLDTFSHLRNEDVELVHKYTNMRDVKKGDTLYMQGTSGKDIYILKTGAIKFTKLTPQGNEIILDIIKGGSVFGESSIMNPDERDESAVVVEDGILCKMKKSDFDMLQQLVPGLSVKIKKMVGLRRWKIENKLLDLLHSTVRQRLARTLLNLLDDFGVPRGENRYLVKVKLTHKDYADLIASTRETTTAAINRLKSDGLIGFEGKYIIINDTEELRAITEE